MTPDPVDDAVEDDAPTNVTPLVVRTARADAHPRERVRMSGQERRLQLLDVGRKLFAEKGFEVVSVEEIAAKANVSKPVVYEHFGGKEGLYAVVVDREMSYLLDSMIKALGSTDDDTSARVLLERAGMALFDYIERYPDGFRILVRDTPVVRDPDAGGVGFTGTFATVIVDVAAKVTDLLEAQFRAHKLNPKWAPLYAQMLVGMVAQTGQWWLDVRKPRKDEVVSHLVNLAWNGLENMEAKPRLVIKDS
ncbi:MAG: TetR/AcrR family transcriptional regulator [Actinomycetota bacterium]|nr:TetR/AcrR family transcriptional regulator [Actinomycetota bacterium]